MTKKIGYMDATDYEWHLEHDAYGVTVYPSEKAVKQHNKCVECEVIKVMITKVD